jgi:hemerythrin-like metal-binding protein
MDITAIWKPEYSVGHKEIDDQHKYLFELWILLDSIKNQKDNRRSLAQALLSLFDYVGVHFENEEKYLKDHPQFDAHKKVHADFITQTQSFMDQFQKENLDTQSVVDYLRNWLIDHIVAMDIRYFNDLEKLNDKK